MRAVNRSLRDDRGMTLVEVMMAVAVFGIILVFITQMSNASSWITGENRDQVRMMELARAEAEKIRVNVADNYPGDDTAAVNIENYFFKYSRTPAGATSDVMITIIAGPVKGEVEGIDAIRNINNYVVVTWVP